MGGARGRWSPKTTVVRSYGRDSVLVWTNVIVAPLLAAIGLCIGVDSEARLAARIEADAAAMRARGYLVASVERFSLPVLGSRQVAASWYRVTYELTSPAGD